MASNSTQTQDKKMAFKPRKTPKADWPEAPPGHWKASIGKGRCRINVSDKGDPRVFIVFKLDEALTDGNETFQGSDVSRMVAFPDTENNPDARKKYNMDKGWTKRLCEALDLDFEEVWPDEIDSMQTIKDFAKKFEGAEGIEIWTTERKVQQDNGEERTYVDVRFTDPDGGSLASEEEEEEDEDRPAARKKKGRR